MKAVRIAINVLDHLDPILGCDLADILEESGDNSKDRLRGIITICKCRQAIHGNNALKDLWQCAIDALNIAIEGVPCVN
jgi:hypothetical protein